jgi:membrane-bound lytic murein transglycosylase B
MASMADRGRSLGGARSTSLPARVAGALGAALFGAALFGAGAADARAAPDVELSRWLAVLGAEALERGISRRTVEATLDGVRPIPRVLELDRRQPVAPKDFCGYLEARLTPTRIARGQRVLAEHEDLLAEIVADYGVPARYLVAIWGLESNFGDYLGDYPLIDALVTLARGSRRAEFFREQIFAALRIVDEEHHGPEGLVGSWAGATGQVQLIPTTYLAYAVDRDGDGRKDVWTSVPDSLATVASILKRSGWRSGETWGRQVRLPAELRLDGPRPLAAWQELGVRRIDGGDLPVANLLADAVLPLRRPGLAFLVYRNYRTFLTWNRSTFFAISVGALADEISGVASLRACGR